MAAWPRTISRRRISRRSEKGFANLERHVENVRKYGVPVVVSVNRFSSDTEAEMALLRRLCATLGVECVLADHWAQGGEGAAELAKTVVSTIETKPSEFKPLYPDDMSLWEKTRTIAQRDLRRRRHHRGQERAGPLRRAREGRFRQVSDLRRQDAVQLHHQSRRQGRAVSGFTIPIREVRLSAGAEFVVVVCGDIMTMPGLPKVPAANNYRAWRRTAASPVYSSVGKGLQGERGDANTLFRARICRPDRGRAKKFKGETMAGARRPGRNFLFVPGPTNVPDRILRAMHVAMEDHRSSDFPKLTLPLYEDLKKIFKTKDGQVVIYPSSGTGAWESALTNTLSPGDKLLAARFGQFSHLWIELAKRHGLEVDRAGGGVGHRRQSRAHRGGAARRQESRDQGRLVVHNETATGVTSDVAAVRRAIDAAKHPALLYVDGVSSIASIDFRMDEWGVDLAITGSQKGLMLPAGLGIVCASQKALAAMKDAKCRQAYFDFDDQMKANATGYFPYTPALPLLYGLRESLAILQRRGSRTSSRATIISPPARAPRSRPGASSSAPRSRNGIPTP